MASQQLASASESRNHQRLCSYRFCPSLPRCLDHTSSRSDRSNNIGTVRSTEHLAASDAAENVARSATEIPSADLPNRTHDAAPNISRRDSVEVGGDIPRR